MKIGFISEHYPPTDGGVATSTQRVARELTKQGVAVQVICFDHSRPINSDDYIIIEHDGDVEVSRVGPFFLKQPSISVNAIPEKVKAMFRRRAFEQMVRILKKNKVDLILSFYLLNAGYLAQFASRELGLPHIAGVRGNDIGRNIFNVERFAVIQWVVNSADRVVCVNEHLMKRLLLAFPAVSSKTEVITNGVLMSDEQLSYANCIKKVHLATGWDDKILRLVFIGTLREKKGVTTLLKAITLLRNKVPVRLLVIGPNLGSVELKLCGDLWTQLKGEGLIFATGMVSRSDVKQWAAGCDVIVMPSLDDGMANGLLEGMALGLCPVVSTVFSDVVNDESGIVVPCGDENALADAIYSLAVDRGKMILLGKNAKTAIADRNPAREVIAYKTLFQSLLSQNLQREY